MLQNQKSPYLKPGSGPYRSKTWKALSTPSPRTRRGLSRMMRVNCTTTAGWPTVLCMLTFTKRRQTNVQGFFTHHWHRCFSGNHRTMWTVLKKPGKTVNPLGKILRTCCYHSMTTTTGFFCVPAGRTNESCVSDNCKWKCNMFYRQNVIGYDSRGSYQPTTRQQRQLDSALNVLFDVDKKKQWVYISETCAKQGDSHSCGTSLAWQWWIGIRFYVGTNGVLFYLQGPTYVTTEIEPYKGLNPLQGHQKIWEMKYLKP